MKVTAMLFEQHKSKKITDEFSAESNIVFSCGNACCGQVRASGNGVRTRSQIYRRSKKADGITFSGELPYRPLGKPVHQPTGREKVSQIPKAWLALEEKVQ